MGAAWGKSPPKGGARAGLGGPHLPLCFCLAGFQLPLKLVLSLTTSVVAVYQVTRVAQRHAAPRGHVLMGQGTHCHAPLGHRGFGAGISVPRGITRAEPRYPAVCSQGSARREAFRLTWWLTWHRCPAGGPAAPGGLRPHHPDRAGRDDEGRGGAAGPVRAGALGEPGHAGGHGEGAQHRQALPVVAGRCVATSTGGLGRASEFRGSPAQAAHGSRW